MNIKKKLIKKDIIYVTFLIQYSLLEFQVKLIMPI